MCAARAVPSSEGPISAERSPDATGWMTCGATVAGTGDAAATAPLPGIAPDSPSASARPSASLGGCTCGATEPPLAACAAPAANAPLDEGSRVAAASVSVGGAGATASPPRTSVMTVCSIARCTGLASGVPWARVPAIGASPPARGEGVPSAAVIGSCGCAATAAAESRGAPSTAVGRTSDDDAAATELAAGRLTISPADIPSTTG